MEYVKDYIVETPCGKIRGTAGKENGIVVFKGIRYGTASRFSYPEEVKTWEGIYEAYRFGNCSYQPRTFYCEADMPEKAFYYREFRQGETYTYSEDCLFLNIWAPENAKAAPVLFYIHGGGFKGGCGHEKHFDGTAYCKKGILVVTINYRLGPLGFLNLPECREEAGHTGNYAMFDQLTALHWVRRNIQGFGGDPDRITIMGQSAGAMSVQQLCVSPLTKGLFCGAVMASGGGVGPELGKTLTSEETYSFWEELKNRTGARDLEELRKLPVEVLFREFQILSKEHKDSMACCSPVVDGLFLEESALEASLHGRQRNIPYICGSTSEDIVPPIVHRMAKGWARLQRDQGKCKSYAFFFDRQLPGDDCGAWHSADLWYEFGTLANGWRPFTDWDYELSNIMVSYLANFVKTGNPNGEGLVPWLPMEKGQNRVMRFGDKDVHMGGVNTLRLIRTMMTKPAVGE